MRACLTSSPDSSQGAEIVRDSTGQTEAASNGLVAGERLTNGAPWPQATAQTSDVGREEPGSTLLELPTDSIRVEALETVLTNGAETK